MPGRSSHAGSLEPRHRPVAEIRPSRRVVGKGTGRGTDLRNESVLADVSTASGIDHARAVIRTVACCELVCVGNGSQPAGDVNRGLRPKQMGGTTWPNA